MRRFRLPVPVVLVAVIAAPTALNGCQSVSVGATSPSRQSGASRSSDSPLSSSLLTPPQQDASWTPPAGDAGAGISPTLATATQTVFAQGLADPRGAAYRTITVQVGSVWRGDGGVVETHGWVFPVAGTDKRYAACWNGLVYPVIADKGPADLRAHVRASLDKYKDLLKKTDSRFGFALFSNRATPEAASLSAEYPSPLMTAYLLRLGENDLARQVAAVLEPKNPSGLIGERETRQDPFLQLATQWAWAAYDRAVCAHMRGADHLAVADTELLTRVQPLIEAEAFKRGYKTFPNGGIHEAGKPFLPFLDNLPALRQDSLRRINAAPRSPLDIKTLQASPQAERIAQLIGRLDEIAARQSGQPGGVGLDADPIAEALITEGDAAVEPLLNVMEQDPRLTRSVSFGRDFFPQRNLLSVKDAAWACFARITNVTEINGGGRSAVANLRAWWAVNKNASPADRWFMQLADEGTSAPPAPATSAPPPSQTAPNTTYDESTRRERQEFERIRNNAKRWEEAAGNIVERGDIQRRGMWVNVPQYKPGQAPPSFKGEPLRGRRNPSVSELLAKRARQMSDPLPGRWGFDFTSGARFALMLYEWDPKGADTAPTLREVTRRCIAFENNLKKEGASDQYQMGGRIARLTVDRLRLGDNAAASEYDAYLRTVSPEYLGFETRSALFGLSEEPENAEMRRTANALFTQEDGAASSASAWNRLLTDPKSRGNPYVTELLASDLLRLSAFRQLVIRRLSDTTEAGSVVKRDESAQGLSFAWLDGSSEGATPNKSAQRRRQTLRVCDRCALALQAVLGSPRFNPMASAAERDKQCAAIGAYLVRYGATLGRATQSREAPEPLYSYAMASRFDFLGPTFPVQTRPATKRDVRENRAIFSLQETNDARVVSDLPASLPIEAQWDKDPNADVATRSDGKKVRWSRGYIWQAEELLEKGQWVRYYGYVGPHSISKVPANDIQITDFRVRSTQKP